MRVVAAILAMLALLLVGCGEKKPSGQSSGAGSVAPSPFTSQSLATSVPPEDDRPVSVEELTAVGYTDKQVTNGHEEWRTGSRVKFPVLVIQDGKITAAKAEDGTFECLPSLTSKPRRLTPATVVVMYQSMLKYKAGSPSTTSAFFERGGTKGSVVCTYAP